MTIRNHTKESILEAVSEFYGMPIETIFAICRKRVIIHARYVAIYLLHKRLWLTQKELCEMFPDLHKDDHTAYGRAINIIEDELEYPQWYPTQEEIVLIIQLSFDKANPNYQYNLSVPEFINSN